MIRKRCDNCDKVLEFDESQAGQKVKCPECGDMNLLPQIADRAVAAGLPPDSGPEQDVLVLRPALFRAHPFLCILTLGIAFLVMWFQHLGESLTITNKRTMRRVGLFSKDTTEVLHDHVRNIQVYQSFWNRVFNVGRIGISSAGQSTIEIVAEAVPRPNEVKKVIDCYRPM